MSNLLSRKFIYAIMVVIMAYVLVILHEVTADQFLKFSEVIGGIYVIGNVGTKLTEVIK